MDGTEKAAPSVPAQTDETPLIVPALPGFELTTIDTELEVAGFPDEHERLEVITT